MKEALVVNLYGGPGTGKSTMCAALFSKLKWAGINCEMSLEYAKGKVWEESFAVLNDQNYVFGKQLHEQNILKDKVDVIVTDSPLPMSLMYGYRESAEFKKHVLEKFNRFNNLNVFLVREKEYNPKGRIQTEDEAKELDKKIREVLDGNHIPHVVVKAREDSVELLLEMTLKELSNLRKLNLIET